MAVPAQFQRIVQSSAQSQAALKIPPPPKHPPEVLDRFPSMRSYDEQLEQWWVQVQFNLRQPTTAPATT